MHRPNQALTRLAPLPGAVPPTGPPQAPNAGAATAGGCAGRGSPPEADDIFALECQFKQ